MKRPIMTLLILCAIPIGLTACGSDDGKRTASASGAAATSTTTASGPKVVASTAWTGALARAAGAEDVTLIAPADVQHPSDYEPRPSDLAAIASADYVVLSEYDGFAKQLRDATGSTAKVVGLTPENTPPKIASDVTALGRAFGTSTEAQTWLTAFEGEYARLSKETRAVAAGKTATAQMFVAPWADFAGIELLGTYGPKPMTPSQLGTLKAKKADLLLENGHLPQGAGLDGDETTKVLLLNYPSGLDLLEVFRKNAAALQAGAM